MKVRVGIVVPGCYLGGVERWVCDLLDFCDPARVEWVGIAVMILPGEFPNLMDDWTEHCPVTEGWTAVGELASKVDVLITVGVIDAYWGFPPSMLGLLIPEGVAVVIVSHGAIESDPRCDQSILFQGVSASVGVSRCALRALQPCRRENARIILNCVSEARVARSMTRSEMLADWGLSPNAKVAGWLSRLSPEKAPERFIRGVAALPEGWHGVMAGPSYKADFYRQIANTEAPGRITFLGPRFDVGDVLGGFDCLVMTSPSEACSLTLAEGMLAGVPLLSTPVGLLQDYPHLARLLPWNPSGRDIAEAVIADLRDTRSALVRVDQAQDFASKRLSPSLFGHNWTELICDVRK
jgi:glycosyltransferase involved in cell wall biosynthesis